MSTITLQAIVVYNLLFLNRLQNRPLEHIRLIKSDFAKHLDIR